ncbi:YybH family protein [Edaphobacter bradus]|uniref:YybH family protein n=1 Tax=Edaphobacter bradus TaxID=2259016 RepID=UPI0021DFCE24|nr:DUF4440 domain-containing protein [Edaphobacter bradus]
MMPRTILLTSLLVVAASLPAHPQQPDSSATITHLRTQWAEALHAKRLDDCLSLYASDAAFLEPRGSRIQGQQALHDLFQIAFSATDSTIQFTSTTIQTSGDLGFDSGSYQETTVLHGTNTTIPVSGNYLTIYRRTPDGRWLIVQQAWTAKTTPLQPQAAASTR